MRRIGVACLEIGLLAIRTFGGAADPGSIFCAMAELKRSRRLVPGMRRIRLDRSRFRRGVALGKKTALEADSSPALGYARGHPETECSKPIAMPERSTSAFISRLPIYGI